jgi:hypothetical protein
MKKTKIFLVLCLTFSAGATSTSEMEGFVRIALGGFGEPSFRAHGYLFGNLDLVDL